MNIVQEVNGLYVRIRSPIWACQLLAHRRLLPSSTAHGCIACDQRTSALHLTLCYQLEFIELSKLFELPGKIPNRALTGRHEKSEASCPGLQLGRLRAG